MRRDVLAPEGRGVSPQDAGPVVESAQGGRPIAEQHPRQGPASLLLLFLLLCLQLFHRLVGHGDGARVSRGTSEASPRSGVGVCAERRCSSSPPPRACVADTLHARWCLFRGESVRARA